MKNKEESRNAMLKIIESFVFLAAQGIVDRGYDDENSNFKQLLKLRSGDCKLA